jgi:WD40 repeat protein
MLSSHLRLWTTYGRGALKAGLACFVALCWVSTLSGAAPPVRRAGFRLVRVIKAYKETARSIDFSPNGKVLATAGDTAVRLWEVSTGKMLREAHFKPDLVSFAYFAQRGRTLVCSTGTTSQFFLLEGNSLKKRAAIPLPEGPIFSVAVSQDGGLLGIGLRGRLTLWEAATGNPRGAVRVTPTNRFAVSVVGIAFAPEGRTVAAAMGDAFARICDLKACKELRRSQPDRLPDGFRMRHLAFIPGSKVLVAGSLGDSRIYLWDAQEDRLLREISWEKPALSGEERARGRRTEKRPGLIALAVAADGKTIAGACMDRHVRLWEVATGKLRRKTAILAGELAFSPAGHLLAMVTAEKGGVIRLWDWRDPGLKRPPRPNARALAELWAKLSNEDAGAAYLAVATLAAHPKEATEFMARHLRRVEPVAAKEVDRQIAALDSDDFESRLRAFTQLEALGKAAEVKLRAALARSKSLEMRKLGRDLLRRMVRITPERLRALRAVETLEHLGTRRARSILARQAEGAAGALQTEDAAAALKRLKLLEATKP